MIPVHPDVAFQIALAHQQAGRVAQAEQFLRQALATQPNHGAAAHQLGIVLLVSGRFAEAVSLLQRAASLAPVNAAVHSDLGVAHWQLRQSSEAIAAFQRAITLRPDFASAHRNLGDVYCATGELELALASYQRALALAPNDAGGCNNIGNVYVKQRRFEEAAAHYRRATELDPNLLQAHSNLGDAMAKLGHLEEAVACAKRVLSLDPSFAGAWLNLGAAQWQMGALREAEASFRRALELQPDFADAHLSLGVICLLQGRFEEGWNEYEWRWRSPTHAVRVRPFTAPVWDGSPIVGKTILVHADQGFGDTLQFSRYLPILLEKSQAARVIFECQPAVVPLLRQLESEEVSVIARGAVEAALPSFDVHVALLSLPRLLRTPQPLPLISPLRAEEALRVKWRTRLAERSGLRVGIAWAGNPEHDDDRRRSMPPERLRPLLQVPGVQFVSLQVGARSRLPAEVPFADVFDAGAELTDFADGAALIAELDLVISVDTATVHLAGALARPVWTLLPYMPDWRWLFEGEQSAWYSTMRLFRQRSPGDWDELVHRVAAALESQVAASQLQPAVERAT